MTIPGALMATAAVLTRKQRTNRRNDRIIPQTETRAKMGHNCRHLLGHHSATHHHRSMDQGTHMTTPRIPKDGTRVTGNTIVGEYFRGIAQQGVINAQILCDGLEWEHATLLPKEIETLHIDQPRKQP